MRASGPARSRTREIKPKIGSRVHADKARLLGGQDAEAIMELLEARGVLLFPQIGFTDPEQVAFTETLGPIARERQGGAVLRTKASWPWRGSRPSLPRD